VSSSSGVASSVSKLLYPCYFTLLVFNAMNRDTCTLAMRNCSRSLSRSFGSTFFYFSYIKNSGFAVVISALSVVVPEIQVLPVWSFFTPYAIRGFISNGNLLEQV